MQKQDKIEFELGLLSKICPKGYNIGIHVRNVTPLFHYSTYPQEWLDRYVQRSYALRDPTIIWAYSAIGACRWSELPVDDPAGLLEEARGYGFNYGVCVSWGPINDRTLGSFVRDDREFTDEEISIILEAVKRIHELSELSEILTDAHLAALRLISQGDRYAEAACKLNISESAFKARLIGARNRLGARTTAEAVKIANKLMLL